MFQMSLSKDLFRLTMALTFKAAVLTNIDQPLELFNLKFSTLLEGQVLVRILFTTICGSQLFEIAGDRGNEKYIPHLLGHEGFGIVEEVGKGVTRFKTGDRVVLTWIRQLGLDCDRISFESETGQRVSAGKVTTFSEYTVVAENRLFKAPEIDNPQILPLLGCAALTGAGMVFERKTFSNRSLVVGAGGVGIFAILALLFLGEKEIHVIEKSETKRKMISQIDQRIVLHSSFHSKSLIQELENRGRFQEVFECTGSITMLQASIDLTSTPGNFIFCSHPRSGETINLDPFDLISGKRVFGSWGGGCEDVSIMNKAIEVTEFYREFIPSTLSNPYGLDSINMAIEDARSGRNFRVLVDMSKKA